MSRILPHTLSNVATRASPSACTRPAMALERATAAAALATAGYTYNKSFAEINCSVAGDLVQQGACPASLSKPGDSAETQPGDLAGGALPLQVRS